MTCLDGYYIYPYSIESMAEVLLKADSRGAIAAFSSSGMSDAEGKHILDEGLFKTIFRDDTTIIGTAAAKAKLYLYLNSSGREDIIKTHTLFGDPTVRMK